MGQAKSKGSIEQRKKQAILKLRGALPDSMNCNKCGESISEIIPLQASKIKGVNGVGFGICPNCDRVTFGFDTTIDNVEDIQNTMANIDLEALYPILESVRADYMNTIEC